MCHNMVIILSLNGFTKMFLVTLILVPRVCFHKGSVIICVHVLDMDEGYSTQRPIDQVHTNQKTIFKN